VTNNLDKYVFVIIILINYNFRKVLLLKFGVLYDFEGPWHVPCMPMPKRPTACSERIDRGGSLPYIVCIGHKALNRRYGLHRLDELL